MAKNKFYVVWKGLNPGIYDNWAECTVKEAVTVGNTVNVKGSRMGMNYELEFGPKEKVQVLQNGETEI